MQRTNPPWTMRKGHKREDPSQEGWILCHHVKRIRESQEKVHIVPRLGVTLDVHSSNCNFSQQKHQGRTKKTIVLTSTDVSQRCVQTETRWLTALCQIIVSQLATSAFRLNSRLRRFSVECLAMSWNHWTRRFEPRYAYRLTYTYM